VSNILEVKNLQKAYGKYVVLKNINFEIASGKIVGLLGKNGAGKTTLIKTLLGLYHEFEGEIIYQGKKIEHANPNVMNTIGALVDVSFHEDMTAYDNLKMLMMVTPGKRRVNYKHEIGELLELVGLGDNAKEKVKSFSFGMKQRLALAQALIADAKLLILDEPFVGLDPLGIEMVKEKLLYLCRERKVSIIFSSHQLAEVAEMSDDIIVISEGEIGYSGSYQDLVNENKKYHIFLDKEFVGAGGMDENDIENHVQANVISVEYSRCNLDDILRKLQNAGYRILDIQIQENALLELFRE